MKTAHPGKRHLHIHFLLHALHVWELCTKTAKNCPSSSGVIILQHEKCSIGQYFRFFVWRLWLHKLVAVYVNPQTTQNTRCVLYVVSKQAVPKQPYSVLETPHTAACCLFQVPQVPSETRKMCTRLTFWLLGDTWTSTHLHSPREVLTIHPRPRQFAVYRCLPSPFNFLRYSIPTVWFVLDNGNTYCQ